MNSIHALKSDNIEMAAIIKQLEEENNKLKKVTIDLERKMSKSSKDISILKKEVLKKDRIINQITDIESKRTMKQTGPSEEQLQ